MFGKYVKLAFEENYIQIWVSCNPDTPDQELEKRALTILQKAMSNNKIKIAKYRHTSSW